MSYLVQRHDRYYVVAYDGIDPRTGHDRRRWRAAGTCLADAEAMR